MKITIIVLTAGMAYSATAAGPIQSTLSSGTPIVIPAVIGVQKPSERMAAVLRVISEERLLSKDCLGERLAAAPVWCLSKESRSEVFFVVQSPIIPDQPRHAVFLSASGEVVVYRMSGMDGRVEWFSMSFRPNKSLEPTATAVTPPAAQESRQP
ncbi:hypothetical protein DB347_09575 [Opitutaceae bacterium EW11]|nr:hypothetical protein DB347_09575 [Opitutaceae bacterium EW11]